MAGLGIQRYTRFVSRDRVVVSFPGREQLRILWTSDISKGGMFIESDDPPEHGASLEISLETPGGNLMLEAEVVHVIDPARARQIGRSAGVGVEFKNLDRARREALRQYVAGVAAQLVAKGEPVTQRLSVPVERVCQAAVGLIREFERGYYYLALDMPPHSTNDELLRRCRELRRLFVGIARKQTPAQETRLRSAAKVLDKLARLFGSPPKRLRYDVEQGHAVSEERIEEALRNDSGELAELRTRWRMFHADEARAASSLCKEARRAAALGDYDLAIVYARRSLEFDPFNPVVRSAIETWKKIEQRKGRAPARTRCQTAVGIPLSSVQARARMRTDAA